MDDKETRGRLEEYPEEETENGGSVWLSNFLCFLLFGVIVWSWLPVFFPRRFPFKIKEPVSSGTFVLVNLDSIEACECQRSVFDEEHVSCLDRSIDLIRAAGDTVSVCVWSEHDASMIHSFKEIRVEMANGTEFVLDVVHGNSADIILSENDDKHIRIDLSLEESWFPLEDTIESISIIMEQMNKIRQLLRQSTGIQRESGS